jgi:hypothetical protein
VLEAERVSELVERREVHDDVARQWIDLDGSIRGNGDLRFIDQSRRAVHVRPRDAVIAAGTIEKDADACLTRDEGPTQSERTFRGCRPRAHRTLGQLIAALRHVLAINPDRNQ